MAVPPQARIPKIGTSVPERQIKTGGDPDSLDRETIAWQFHRLDNDHEDWGWNGLKAGIWKEILRQLKAFEGLTWAKLKEAAGGRRHGTNHHPIEVANFCNKAKDRLKSLHLDEYDSLFSLRLANKIRIYGVRDGRVLQLVWYDPHHGDKRGAYPIKK